LYFTTLTLEDFQGHTKSVFNLDKGLNVIVGLSNAGKSSISRALQFILMGSPWDKSWVRFGSKYCKITLETSTGITVLRIKGDKVNKYTLTLPNQQPQDFESFGVGVPEAIQQALNIHEVQINNTESLNLNVALQHDNLFLLSAVPSVRARVLGKLSGADILDSSIQSINKDKRQLTAEKQSKELELVDLQAQESKLALIESYSTIIQDIESKLTSLSTQEARLQAVRSLFQRVKVLKANWTRETAIEAALANIDLSSIGQLAQRVDKIGKISLLLDRIVKQRYTEQNILKQTELLKQIDLTVIPFLDSKILKINKIRALHSNFCQVLSQIQSKEVSLQDIEQKYKLVKQQYSDILKEGKICPICGTSTLEVNNNG
jgi:DNA repair exonuclease SbcCD ATPase subunit